MRILVVDDDPTLSKILERHLLNRGFEVTSVHGVSAALESLKTMTPDVAFVDLLLPDGPGLELLEQIRRSHPRTHVFMMSGGNTTKSSVSAMRLGADDCIDKPFALEEVDRLLETCQTSARPVWESTQGGQDPLYLKEYLFLRDDSMTDIYETIGQVAKADGVTVLILGETGTGKQHVARLIHHLSNRPKGPFVELHCGALPETLLESELFGYEAGAFTDAKKAKPGLMEIAQGGTLFLDEIGELPLSIQAKLLKVLEQKTLRRLGGVRETRLDLRLVAATNRNLRSDIKEGRFRADLYYRLNLMSIKMPPLRGRPEAIESLARFFVEEVCATYGRARAVLSPDVLRAFAGYDWPGNIRELKNVVCRMILSAEGRDLRFANLPEELMEPRRQEGSLGTVNTPPERLETVARFDDMERVALVKALEATGWNRTQAALVLGVSRRTVVNKIHKWNLAPSMSNP